MAKPQAVAQQISPELTEKQERVLSFFAWLDDSENFGLQMKMIGIADEAEWRAAVDRLLELGFVSAGAAASVQ